MYISEQYIEEGLKSWIKNKLKDKVEEKKEEFNNKVYTPQGFKKWKKSVTTKEGIKQRLKTAGKDYGDHALDQLGLGFVPPTIEKIKQIKDEN